MTHRLNLLMAALLLIFGLPLHWLFLDNPSRRIDPYPLSITQIRALGASLPSPRATAVEYVPIGVRREAGNVHAAGAGIRSTNFSINAFLLTGAPGGPVVIDTGTSPALAVQLELERFDARRQADLDAAFAGAQVILATGDGPEHLGGLAAFAARQPPAVALAGARLNPAQVRSLAISGFGRDTITTSPDPVAVAPGVVVIPTGAPTPGSQIIYARLMDGREYVFAGGLAPYALNLRELRVRSLWLDRHQSAGNRTAAMRWLRTLREWQRQAPGLILLPGHDRDWVLDGTNRTGVTLASGIIRSQKRAGS